MKSVSAGLIVALTLVPESIAFSVLAGVDPQAGLFATFVLALVTSLLGGRPGMVSAATGAVATVIALVSPHGMGYVLATVILAGLIQLCLSPFRVIRVLDHISPPVMSGFINSLAMLVFLAQLPQLTSLRVCGLVAFGVLLMVVLPRFQLPVPTPLITIAVITALSFWVHVPTVADQGTLPHLLPRFSTPHLPLTWHTLLVIGPAALTMAIVGLLETLVTARMVDSITNTRTQSRRECAAQGVANMLSGFSGGMGGCAELGPTLLNVKHMGVSTRASTAIAGVLVLAISLSPAVGYVPMAALVSVMLVVSFVSVEWRAFRRPGSPLTALTMLLTALTHNLALSVLITTAGERLFRLVANRSA